MEERLIFLGKIKCKSLDKDFDQIYQKFESRAKERGYLNNKLKLIKEHNVVKIYVVIDLDEDLDTQ